MDQNQSGSIKNHVSNGVNFQKFPKGFLFGSATSAFQTEGYDFNTDWHEWEKTGATTDHKTDHPAANSWHKWPEDIELLKQTGQNAYRFGVEWARIEPEEGKFDEAAINHYREILEALKKNDIASMVTLHHFTLPLWLAKKGGFLNKQFSFYFDRYAEKVISQIGNLADFWTTFNEPKIYILAGYIQGKFPPNQRSYYKAYFAIKNLIKAHIRAYKTIKTIDKNIKVGLNQNIAAFQPENNRYFDKLAVRIARYFDSVIFIKPTNRYTDFLGINYYVKFIIQAKKPFSRQSSSFKNDLGWRINQEGLYQVIKENLKWGKPIYITENGCADENDNIRPEFIRQALENIRNAIHDGADVKGYFYWSLLDNFELNDGYIYKFGLHTIDRQPRPSAKVYTDLIKKYQSEYIED